jgi:hypothetical protein
MQTKTGENLTMQRKTFFTYMAVAALVGAGVMLFFVKGLAYLHLLFATTAGPLTADGSPITVSGDLIHYLHMKMDFDKTKPFDAKAHHGKNQPKSIRMEGCAQTSCQVTLMQGWTAALLVGATVDSTGNISSRGTDVADFTDVPDNSGSANQDNTVTIHANMYPFQPNPNPNTGVDQVGSGNYFYFNAISVTSGGATTNLSCSMAGPGCTIEMGYCAKGNPVPGSPTYCQQ